MSRFWFVMFAQLFTFAACFLVWLADQWLTVGHGLNPWLALPAATVLVGICPILAERADFRANRR